MLSCIFDAYSPWTSSWKKTGSRLYVSVHVCIFLVCAQILENSMWFYIWLWCILVTLQVWAEKYRWLSNFCKKLIFYIRCEVEHVPVGTWHLIYSNILLKRKTRGKKLFTINAKLLFKSENAISLWGGSSNREVFRSYFLGAPPKLNSNVLL